MSERTAAFLTSLLPCSLYRMFTSRCSALTCLSCWKLAKVSENWGKIVAASILSLTSIYVDSSMEAAWLMRITACRWSASLAVDSRII